MKTKLKLGIFAALIGIVYLIFKAIPLFKNKKTSNVKTTEWCEEPMMIDMNYE